MFSYTPRWKIIFDSRNRQTIICVFKSAHRSCGLVYTVFVTENWTHTFVNCLIQSLIPLISHKYSMYDLITCAYNAVLYIHVYIQFICNSMSWYNMKCNIQYKIRYNIYNLMLCTHNDVLCTCLYEYNLSVIVWAGSTYYNINILFIFIF